TLDARFPRPALYMRDFETRLARILRNLCQQMIRRRVRKNKRSTEVGQPLADHLTSEHIGWTVMAMERTSYGDLVLSLSPPADACWFATAFLFNARIQQCDLLCRPYFGKILDVQVGGGDEHTLALSVDSG